jgi:hypothetical protein
MKHRHWFGLFMMVAVAWLLAPAAQTQERAATDFRSLLEQQQSELGDERDRPALARQLVRERIGAARQSRENLVPVSRGG